MTADPLSLAVRHGLPADLRWLLARHPRPSWTDSLGEIGRFWLARHAMFRETQALLLDETRAFAAGRTDAARFGPRFGRVAGFLLGELDSHHGIEDHHYFPRLARIEPRLQRGFDLLDADHHALHDALEGLADMANAVLRGLRADGARDTALREAARAAGRAAEGLDALGRLLDRHLADEEDIVAPILVAHGERGLG
jgi:iron-sulfur cluster repair protein YtfE (RIC family)